MTNDEKELMRDLINQASNKVELLQKTVIEKDFEIERLKTEVKQAQIDVLNRLKVFSEPYPNSWGIYVIDVYHIDELIKEVENDKRRD